MTTQLCRDGERVDSRVLRSGAADGDRAGAGIANACVDSLGREIRSPHSDLSASCVSGTGTPGSPWARLMRLIAAWSQAARPSASTPIISSTPMQ